VRSVDRSTDAFIVNQQSKINNQNLPTDVATMPMW